jgi:predicted ATP-grasp superfamily ATP-dependent carboligase
MMNRLLLIFLVLITMGCSKPQLIPTSKVCPENVPTPVVIYPNGNWSIQKVARNAKIIIENEKMKSATIKCYEEK